MALQSAEEATVVSQATLPSTTCSRVRVELEDAQAFLTAGAVIDGSVLDVAVSLLVGGPDAALVAEKDVPDFTVDASSTTTVLVDLDSEAWVTSESVSAETVEDAAVASAVSVRVEG